MNAPTPPLLTTLNPGAETVAIVPASMLSWHQVQLPAGTLSGRAFAERSGPRQRAVLEGLLEDQLLDEPAQLHFALQPDARNGEPVWVAVCDRAWLRAALDALSQAGHAPHRVVPEWAPSPGGAAGSLWACGSEDAAQLVWVDAHGVHRVPLTGAQATPAAVWALLPAEAAQATELMAEPAVAQLAEHLLHREVRVLTVEQRQQQSAQAAWNLAQFDMAPVHPWMARCTVWIAALWAGSQWRPARWALAALLAVQLVGLNAFAWHAQQQLQHQRVMLTGILTSTFPQTKVVVDAPLQMARAVELLRQSSGVLAARDLERLLHVYGSNLPPALASQAPTAIEFVAGELRVSGIKASPEQVQALDAALHALGFVSQSDGVALLIRPGNNAP